MPSFDELPDEIVVKILCLVTSAPSVLNCRLVNQRLRSCIDSSSSIQYSVMLDAWGYENIISGTPLRDIPSEKLKALEKHQKSWALLDWKEHRTSIPFSRTYHVSQGFLYAPSQDNSIICITLPSRLTGQTLMSQKLHHVFDFEIAALASDPSQGLLAVVELWVPFQFYLLLWTNFAYHIHVLSILAPAHSKTNLSKCIFAVSVKIDLTLEPSRPQ